MTTPANTPWLSILVPAYNAQAYLEECLASVMDRADPGVEVLVLDDCSTDETHRLLQALQGRWPGRLRVLRHEHNQGQSAARNAMLDVARGEYLWFLDADDKLLPGALDRLRAIVQGHAPDLVLCDFQVWREHPRLKHRLRGERHRRTFEGLARHLTHDRCALLAGMLVMGQLHVWSKVSRRALWGDDLRFPVGRLFEDMTVVPLVALRADRFFYEPEPWVAYRQHAASSLATIRLPRVQDQVAALSPLRQALRGTPCEAHAGVQMAMAHQCARNFIGATRSVRRLATAQQPMDEILARLREDFCATSPLSPEALSRAYLLRGWWLRWLKFRRAYSHQQS